MWELYHVDVDPAESKNLAKEQPDKLQTLIEAWVEEAEKNHGSRFGATKLYVNDKVVAEGPMRAQDGKFTLSGDGLCVGRDSGDAVSHEYQSPGVSMEGEQYLDLEKIAAAAYAVD